MTEAVIIYDNGLRHERVKQIYLELKISMRSFLNIRIKILRNSLKNIRDAVFNLITLQTKGLQLY